MVSCGELFAIVANCRGSSRPLSASAAARVARGRRNRDRDEPVGNVAAQLRVRLGAGAADQHRRRPRPATEPPALYPDILVGCRQFCDDVTVLGVIRDLGD